MRDRSMLIAFSCIYGLAVLVVSGLSLLDGFHMLVAIAGNEETTIFQQMLAYQMIWNGMALVGIAIIAFGVAVRVPTREAVEWVTGAEAQARAKRAPSP